MDKAERPGPRKAEPAPEMAAATVLPACQPLLLAGARLAQAASRQIPKRKFFTTAGTFPGNPHPIRHEPW